MRAEAEPPSSWDGFEYEKVSALQRRVGLPFVDALDLDTPHRILDVGCGDGFLTEKIAVRSQADVVGVDFSAAMLARVRERSSERLSFVELDVNTMVFDEPFDLIVSLNTLHWVLDLPGAFARLFAAEADGGQLVCQLVGASEVPAIEDMAVVITKESAWRSSFEPDFRPYVHPAESELRQSAEGAGYRCIEITAWTERFTFPSERDFQRWCAAGMSVWTNLLPEARRASFIDAVVARYSGLHGVPREFQFAQVRVSAERPRQSA